MKPFNIKNLKRKPDAIKAYFKNVGDSMIVKEDIIVMFPSRYINKKLATMGATVSVMAIFAIIDDNGNYGVVNAPIMVVLTPYMTGEVDVDGKEYITLEFTKNDVFMESTTIVKRDGFVYDLFDEFLIHGNIPWYLSYEDTSRIFERSKKYAGTGIGDNPLSMELLTSIIARDKKDKTILIRKTIKTEAVKKKNTPTYTALLNIYYSFTSTVSKLTGSYFKAGVTSALVNQETEATTVEKMITA